MIKTLRLELYKLTHSPLLLIILVALVALNVYISSRVDVQSGSQFMFQYQDFTLDVAKKLVDLPESQATDLYELYLDVQPRQLTTLLCDQLAMLVLSAVLPAYMIASDIRRRGLNNALYAGASRTSLYFSKVLAYYLTVAVVSFLSVYLLITFYAWSVFERLPSQYVWGRIFLRVLMDMGIMSVPMLLAFLVKRPLPAAFLSLAYTAGMYFARLGFEPGAMKQSAALWEQGASTGSAVLSSLVFIAACILLSWPCFTKAKFR